MAHGLHVSHRTHVEDNLQELFPLFHIQILGVVLGLAHLATNVSVCFAILPALTLPSFHLQTPEHPLSVQLLLWWHSDILNSGVCSRRWALKGASEKSEVGEQRTAMVRGVLDQGCMQWWQWLIVAANIPFPTLFNLLFHVVVWDVGWGSIQAIVGTYRSHETTWRRVCFLLSPLCCFQGWNSRSPGVYNKLSYPLRHLTSLHLFLFWVEGNLAR